MASCHLQFHPARIRLRRMLLDDDADVAAEPGAGGDQLLGGDPAQLAPEKVREAGLWDADQTGQRGLGEPVFVKACFEAGKAVIASAAK